MADETLSRIKKLRRYLVKNELDSALITDLKNVFYYSGYTGTSAYLVIGLDFLYLMTDFRYITQAKEQCPHYEIIDIRQNDIKKICANLEMTGFENLSISYNSYMKFKNVFKNLICMNGAILEFRAKKSAAEIKNIKKAVDIADKAFTHILKFAKAGMTEIEVANEIDFFMKKNGAEGNSFDTICASGKRGALPHGFPTSKKLENGDLVVLDYGCVYNGYCSDITRTFAVGDVSNEAKKVYDTVLKAQKEAEDFLSAGKKCADAHILAAKIIDKSYCGYFGHALGHGVGLDIHEQPTLAPKNESVLCAGNIVTVEPGIYIPSFGGVRIEDMVCIKRDGIEILTKSDKDLKVI